MQCNAILSSFRNLSHPSQILSELLEQSIITSTISASGGPVFTDELKTGDSLSTAYGDSLNVFVSYYQVNLKAVYVAVNDAPATCLPRAKFIDINYPVCGGSIAVHVISQVLLPESCTIFPTIEEVALDTPELSLLAEAFSILDDNEVVIPGITQFAPTNLAWNRAFLLLASSKDAVFNNIAMLQDIVLYNRVEDQTAICQISDGQELATDPVGAFNPQSDFLNTAAVYPLKVSIRSVLERLCGGQLANLYIFRRIVIIGQINSATVLVPDIQACDGRVYITDAVLLPPTLFLSFTLMDLICSATVLQTFCSIIRDTPLTSILDALSNPASKYVVFAPTDYAIESALAYLKLDPALLTEGELDVLIGYHIVQQDFFNPGAAFTFEFRDEVDSFENIDEDDLNIVVLGTFPLEAFFVDGGCNRAQVIVPLSNRLAVNGVLHVIDRLLLPSGTQKFCPSVCSRLELNPLTTVFIAAIYALGLENEYCTVASSNTDTTYEPPRMEDGTIFAPTDLAFAKSLYQRGFTVFNIFLTYPEELYDTILYHTSPGSTVYAADIVNGATYTTALTEGFPPLSTGHISQVDGYGGTPPRLTARRFDSFTLIRKNLLRSAIFIEGDDCFWNFYPSIQDGSRCAGRIIVPDQRTITGAVIHTIDQVLSPGILTCADPFDDGSGLALGIAAQVTYVGPIGCSLFCTGVITRCLPCSPFVAQEIYTSPVDANPLGSFSDVVYTLYVNQLGEVRWGQVPGFIKSEWTGNHAIGPIGLIKAGASIVAQGFIATNLKTFNVIANAIDVTSITSADSDDATSSALLKIYIDGHLKGMAVVTFTGIISLAEIQFQFNELIEHYIIKRPLFSIRAANYPGPVVQPSPAGLENPLTGSVATLVDAGSLQNGDATWNNALSSANETITAMQAIGEEVATAQTIFYAIRSGKNPVEAFLVRSSLVTTVTICRSSYYYSLFIL